MALVYSQNFDALTVGTVPANYINVGTANFQVTNTRSISAPNSLSSIAGADSDIVVIKAVPATADSYFSFTENWVGVNASYGDQQFVLMRAQTDGTTANTSGYMVGYVAGSGVVNSFCYKIISGAYTAVGAAINNTGFTIPSLNDTVGVEVGVVGTNISLKIWNITLGQTKPATAQVTFTDSSITAAGYPGFRRSTTGTVPNRAFVDDIAVNNTVAAVGVSVSLADTNILLSPYTWVVNGAAASPTSLQTTSGAAYLKMGFTGTSVSVLIDTTTLAGNIVYYSVDNQAIGTLTTSASNGSISFTGLAAANHQLRIVVAYQSQGGGDRWITPTSLIRITGISIDSGASTIAPPVKAKKMLLYGDSITEAAAGTNPNQRTGSSSDSSQGYALNLADGLGAEAGVRGFGGVGMVYNNASSPALVGNVPPFYTPGTDASSNWNKLDSTHSLLTASVYTVQPDYISLCFGVNDYFWNLGNSTQGTPAQVQASLQGVLPLIRTAAPAAQIFIIVPFSGFNRSAITAAFTAYQSSTPDANATLIDLGNQAGLSIENGGGVATTNSSDGVHPNLPTYARLAADLVQAAQPVQPTLTQIATAVWARSQRTVTA